MSDISLLPEEMRDKEQQNHPKDAPQDEASVSDALRMHVPDFEPDENIEIIEVDEGDLAAVLSDEPFMTRLTYQASLLFDKIRSQFTQGGDSAPPAKAPPQFFKPPKSGLVSVAGSSKSKESGDTPSVEGRPNLQTRPTSRGKARITPKGGIAPKRVRVIRRVHKPVQVSLVSEDDLEFYSVDVPRRKFTIAIFTFVFVGLIIGGFFYLGYQEARAEERLRDVDSRLKILRATTSETLKHWSNYEDLEVRLKILDGALNEHIVISRLFDFLEENTLPTVSYRTATWSSDGALSLDVVADNFDNAALQLIVLEQSEWVEDLDASAFAAQYDSETGALDTVAFQILINMNVDLLRGPEWVEQSDSEESDQDTESSDTMMPSVIDEL